MKIHRLVGFIFLVSTLSPYFAFAAPDGFPCDNPISATKEMVEAANGGIKVGQLICPTDIKTGGFSNDAGAAKAYLNSLPNQCVGDCQAPPDKAHVDLLNNTLAVCAAEFFKAYQAQYGPVGLSSAFRCGPSSPSEIKCDRTENNRAGGAPNSNHQLGLAIDVNPKGGNASYETMWSFAQANPKFGVCFPYLGSDRPHLTLAGSNTGEAARCATQGITKPCDGLPFTPVAAQQISSSASQQGLIQRAMQGFQNYFNPPPPPQCPQGTVLMNGSCLPQQAQAYNQMTSPYSYAQPASQTTAGNTGAGSTGSSITIGSGTGGTGTEIGIPNNVSGLLDATKNPKPSSTSTSAIDLINAIANPTTTGATIATGTPIALNGSLGATAVLNGTKSATSSTLSATNTYALAPQTSQTFVSQDLSKTGSNYAIGSTNSTFSLLENIKQILLSILSNLRPFGGTSANTQIIRPGVQSVTAYME